MEALRKKIIMFAESAWIAGTSCRGASVGQQANEWKFYVARGDVQEQFADVLSNISLVNRNAVATAFLEGAEWFFFRADAKPPMSRDDAKKAAEDYASGGNWVKDGRCSRCGLHAGITVRAFDECPECIAHRPKREGES